MRKRLTSDKLWKEYSRIREIMSNYDSLMHPKEYKILNQKAWVVIEKYLDALLKEVCK